MIALFDVGDGCSSTCSSRRPAPTPVEDPRGARAVTPAVPRGDGRFPDEAQAMLVETVGAGPRPMELRIAALNKLRPGHVRTQTVKAAQRTKAARRTPRPTRRSRSSARRSSSSRASCARASRSVSTGDLQPLVERLILGPAHAATARSLSPARRRSAPNALSGSRSSRAESSTASQCPRLVAWRELVARRSGLVPDGTTGAGRSRASAIPRPASWSSVWRRPRTAPIAPAGVHWRPLGRLSVRGAAPGRASPTSRLPNTGATGWRFPTSITAAVRCAPPANKPTPAERDTCMPCLDASFDC